MFGIGLVELMILLFISLIGITIVAAFFAGIYYVIRLANRQSEKEDS